MLSNDWWILVVSAEQSFARPVLFPLHCFHCVNVFPTYRSKCSLNTLPLTVDLNTIRQHHTELTHRALSKVGLCLTCPRCFGFLLSLPSLSSMLTTWDAHLSAFCFKFTLHYTLCIYKHLYICKHVAGTAFFFFYENVIVSYRLFCVLFFSSCNMWKFPLVTCYEPYSFTPSGCITSRRKNIP